MFENNSLFTVVIATWSITERREIRNFPYPTVFELTGRQRLTVKKRNRKVGQFLAAEVTNPGQNESQQMFALCDRMVKERGRMIGQYTKAEVVPFSSEEIGIRKSVLKTDVAMNAWTNLMPNSRWKSGKNLGQVELMPSSQSCKKIPLARKRENTLRRNPPKS